MYNICGTYHFSVRANVFFCLPPLLSCTKIGGNTHATFPQLQNFNSAHKHRHTDLVALFFIY